jgi:hypothetical protein
MHTIYNTLLCTPNKLIHPINQAVYLPHCFSLFTAFQLTSKGNKEGDQVPFSPITSTYPLPFFFPFAPPAFLPPALGGPSKSSILLALLMLVPGRLGGPLPATPLLELLDIFGGIKLDTGGVGFASPSKNAAGGGCMPLSLTALCPIPGGGPLIVFGALVCPPLPGGPELVLGGPALGGGGVADLASVCSAPAFLLTHRFRSGS